MLNRPFSDTLKCDKTKPFCLYNNEENNIKKNKQFLVHKTNHEIKIINNYFFENVYNNLQKENDEMKKISENIENQLNIESINDFNISTDSLIIERQKHLCEEK